MVSLFHFRVNSHFADMLIIKNSWLFVDFFFVLSGFVIAHAYAERIVAGTVSPARFLALRLGRIYPLHISVLMVMIAIEILLFCFDFSEVTSREPFSGSRSIEAIFSNLFLLQSFGVHDRLSWNASAWSIAAEFWAYVIFALVMSVAGQFGRTVMVLLGGLSLAWLATFSPDYANTTFNYGFIRCLAGFGIGSGVQWLYGRGVRISGGRSEFTALGIALMFVAIAAEGWATLMAPVVFAFVVWIFASESGAISRKLCNSFLTLLGTLSYSFYMLHGFIQARMGDVIKLWGSLFGLRLLPGSAMNDEFPSEIIDCSPWLGDMLTLLMLILVLGASLASYRLIEFPGREWVRSLLHRRERLALSDP